MAAAINPEVLRLNIEMQAKQRQSALEHDTWVCIQVGSMLHALEHHVSNEARDNEVERRGLNQDQVDLLIRLFRLYIDTRAAGNSEATSIAACKRSIIYRNLCVALGDIVLGVD